jgi:hypothetical protein
VKERESEGVQDEERGREKEVGRKKERETERVDFG